MSNEDATVEKVWKFDYEGRDKKRLKGTFVASQDEIDWITGQIIDFGDSGNGLSTVISMDAEYFQVANEDEDFVEQFKTAIGTSGISPFDMLDDEQFAAHDLTFGATCVEGIPIEVHDPEPEFSDESARTLTHKLDKYVITYEITTDIINGYIANDAGYDSHYQKELDRFNLLFEIVKPQGYAVHLSSREHSYPYDSLNCMKVIRRKGDGSLFGYHYESSEDKYFAPNGNQYEIGNSDRPAYVWLPVMPFTIIGYTEYNN